MVGLFNPAMVVVDGLVAQTGDLLVEPIRQVVYKQSFSTSNHAVRITRAMLGHRSSGIGAVIQASTIALHHVATHKGLEFTKATHSMSLVTL